MILGLLASFHNTEEHELQPKAIWKKASEIGLKACLGRLGSITEHYLIKTMVELLTFSFNRKQELIGKRLPSDVEK